MKPIMHGVIAIGLILLIVHAIQAATGRTPIAPNAIPIGVVMVVLWMIAGKLNSPAVPKKGGWNAAWLVWGFGGAGLFIMLGIYGPFLAGTKVESLGLTRPPSQDWIALSATAQPLPVIVQPAAQPAPTQPQPVPVAAHPETNGADVGVVAVQELGKAVEREQRQNEVLAQRPSADLLIVALVIIGILVAVLVIVAGGRRNRQDAQPDPGYRIQAPTTPAQLKPGDWFEVNGKLFQVPELPAANTQKQIGKRC